MPAPCGDKTPGFYRRRTPRESPLFQLLEQYFEEFEQVYPDRYQNRYGFFRPVIRKAVNAFLDTAATFVKDLPAFVAPTAAMICLSRSPVSSAVSARAVIKSACWSPRSTLPRMWRSQYLIGNLSLPCRNASVLSFAMTGICSNIFRVSPGKRYAMSTARSSIAMMLNLAWLAHPRPLAI